MDSALKKRRKLLSARIFKECEYIEKEKQEIRCINNDFGNSSGFDESGEE